MVAKSKDEKGRQYVLSLKSEMKDASFRKVIEGRFPSSNPHLDAVGRRLAGSGVFGSKPPGRK